MSAFTINAYFLLFWLYFHTMLYGYIDQNEKVNDVFSYSLRLQSSFTDTAREQNHIRHTQNAVKDIYIILYNLIRFLSTRCFCFPALSGRHRNRIDAVLLLLSGHWILCFDQGAELDEIVDNYGHRQDDEQNPDHYTEEAYQPALTWCRKHVSITHCGQRDHSPPTTRGNVSEDRIIRVNFCVINHGTKDKCADEEY